ncbi:MAG: type secretion system protein [Mycobacterium sp.]|nr:type secretion system protein [Mycobacterium sp.]
MTAVAPGVGAGAAVGGLAAAGLLLAAARLPALRRPRLADRVEPYLRRDVPTSRLLDGVTPRPSVVGALLGPSLARGAAWVERWVGGTASVRRRLAAAGDRTPLEQFRVDQVTWAATGALAALGLLVLRVATGVGPPAATALLLVPALGLFGLLARDWRLSQQVRAREAAVLAELPTVAELLALAVAAGESPVAALARVARASGGPLADEIGRALADVRAGEQLTVALDAVGARSGLPALVRFLDGMVIAIERGTPLADVLRAQAVDVREEGKRALLAAAGRKEVAMLVPVVFLVLPVTVVFALYPGLVNLQLLVR